MPASCLRLVADIGGATARCALAGGGVYLAGGIVRCIAAFLAARRFRARCAHKVAMRGYLQCIPACVALAAEPGLHGAARAALDHQEDNA